MPHRLAGRQTVASASATVQKAAVRRRISLALVVYTEDKMGQQNVNKAAPEHPRTCELIWLNGAFRPACPSRHKSLAPTFNSKVTGSIPVRPIIKSLQIWAEIHIF